jgi:biopolymer transport protein ExbD
MAAGKSKFEDEPASSFTSMIDIVFLLLIFFILQPFKAKEMKLVNELPKDQGPASTPDTRETVRIRIVPATIGEKAKERANFMVNSTMLGENYERLAQEVRNAAKGDSEVPVALAPHPAVHFVHVLRALDQCHIARMTKVSFEAPPPRTAVKK